MSAWLHFIDKEYYYISAFIKEAQSVGISRSVSLDILKQMQWGDKVACCQVEPGLKSPSVFLEFPIEAITGLAREVHRDIMSRFPCRIIDLGGQVVLRRCGEYITGIAIETEATVEDIVKVIEEHDGNNGQPMIGCGAESVKFFEKPRPILPDILFCQDFRLYDRELLMKAIQFAGRGKRARAKGQLCVRSCEKTEATYGCVQEVVKTF